jgi:ATP-dependent exoDNAse (exonuclease V) beta subunit
MLAGDPGRFVRAVAERMSGAAEQARIRVMTVHMSKGLEFDEVVCASLGETLGRVEGGAGEWAALVPEPTGAPVAIAPVVNKEFVSLSPLLAAFRAEAQVARLGDDVSKLYVALTRAKEAIHLVCPPRSSSDEPRPTPTWLLRRAVDGFEQAYMTAAPGAGDARFWTFVPPGESLGELPATPARTERAATAPTAPELERVARPTGVRAPSTHAGDGSTFFASEFEGLPDGERGSIAHAWFERIRWRGEAALDAIDEAALLDAVAIEIGRPVDRALAGEVRTMVDRAIAGPMGAVLDRARTEAWRCDSIEVRAEMPFAAVLGGTLVRGRMDRVVLGIAGGRVVRAEVVDWKTGAAAAQGADFERRIAGYREQMDGYRRAVSAMFGLDAACVTAVLAFPERGQLVEISGPFAG